MCLLKNENHGLDVYFMKEVRKQIILYLTVTNNCPQIRELMLCSFEGNQGIRVLLKYIFCVRSLPSMPHI